MERIVRLSCGCTEYLEQRPITYTIQGKTYSGTFCIPCIDKYKRNPDIKVHDDEEDDKDGS